MNKSGARERAGMLTCRSALPADTVSQQIERGIMQRIRLVALSSIIATLVLFALGPGNVVHAVNNAIQNVFVTNTAANPVPVTGAVEVSNSVAVGGTVSVDNFPATQPVRNIDERARHPFQ